MDAITVEQRVEALQLCFELDAMGGLRGPARLDDARDEVDKVDVLPKDAEAAGAHARDVQQVVDKPGQAIGVLLEGVQPGHVLLMLPLLLKVPRDDLGEAPDRGERRAKLVRHDRDELIAEPLGFLQRRDVLEDADHGVDLSVVCAERGSAGDDRDDAATGRADVQLDAGHRDALVHRLDHRHDRDRIRRVAGHAKLVDPAGHELRGVRLEPEHALGGGVESDDDAMRRTRDHHGLRHRLDDGLEAAMAVLDAVQQLVLLVGKPRGLHKRDCPVSQRLQAGYRRL